MKKGKWRIMAGCLAISLMVGMLPSSVVRAQEAELTTDMIEMQNYTVETESAETLLQGYLDDQIADKEDGITCYSTTAGDNLVDITKQVYDRIKPRIQQIAEGTLTDTHMTVTLEELGLKDVRLSAADLGVSTIVDPSTNMISAEAQAAVKERYPYSGRDVMNALVRDCPYELYWFGNSVWCNDLQPLPYRTSADGEYVLYFGYDLSVDFVVSGDYSAGDFTTDTQKIGAVNTAITNAKQIAQYPATQGYTDLQTLQYFHDKICELTDYNYNAASSSYTGGYGNPWQLIWVFDNDPDTDVVCEGYAKAFKYLCDIATFHNSQISASTMTGTLYFSSGGSGPHMWNTIHMDDGKNYLVDITNCDDAICGNWLFITPYTSGDVENGYTIKDPNSSYRTYKYVYDDDTKTIYTQEDLNLSSDAYVENTNPPVDPNPVEPTPSVPTPATYTVYYDANGGSVSVRTQMVTNGQKYGSMPTPSCTGYQFVGWYTARNGGVQVVNASVVNLNSDQTLYAHWAYPGGVEGFVTRLYYECLNRTPDYDGYSYWINLLKSRQMTGAQAAYGFINSEEFKNKNYCDSCYIEKLYCTILGRSSDAEGKQYWTGLLNAGNSREWVYNGFATSIEFTNICNAYDVARGDCVPEPAVGTYNVGKCSGCGKADDVSAFVERLYATCLNRGSDGDGERYWVTLLKSRSQTGTQVAYGFVFSAEFQNRCYNNADYIEHLYRACLGRGSDAGGKQYWLNLMNAGYGREWVFYGFANSAEFGNICNTYHINR